MMMIMCPQNYESMFIFVKDMYMMFFFSGTRRIMYIVPKKSSHYYLHLLRYVQKYTLSVNSFACRSIYTRPQHVLRRQRMRNVHNAAHDPVASVRQFVCHAAKVCKNRLNGSRSCSEWRLIGVLYGVPIPIQRWEVAAGGASVSDCKNMERMF